MRGQHGKLLALWLLACACGRTHLDPGWLGEGPLAGASGTAVSGGGGSFTSGGTLVTGGTFGTAGTFTMGGMFGTAGTITMGGVNATAGQSGGAGEANVGGDSGDGPVMWVVLGHEHACAVSELLELKCWGAGDSGALGYGDTISRGDNEDLTTLANVAVTDDPGLSIGLVVAGGHHTCVLFSENLSVKCWGKNDDGQLGYGDTLGTRGSVDEPRDLPLLELSTANVSVSQLCAGESHTCALLSDETVKCWGSNELGQLGYPGVARVGAEETPADVDPVELSSEPSVGATRLSCGSNHTCVVLTDGTAKCWGKNESGQLGQGHTENIGDDESPASIDSISLTTATSQFPTLTAGESHTCAKYGDHVSCWGLAAALGIEASENIGDDELPSSAPELTFGPPNGPALNWIKAGRQHTCAQFQDGTLKCWGENTFGELGYGNLAVVDNPADVGFLPLDQGLGSVSSYAVGNLVTCAIADSSGAGGRLYCFGWNDYGQLGRADTFPLGDDEAITSRGPLPVF